jgi:hypothetical protein
MNSKALMTTEPKQMAIEMLQLTDTKISVPAGIA